ncbi:phage tail-collar fiber domain-containing protein [Vibrio jasicida]|uniref:phage tail-collar fiber domain-containing protein n=1 Tax=Vibrio jasicida TaxID=766224 RepID=UPI0006978742|nr:phage tail protein [Vibrio jasicida]
MTQTVITNHFNAYKADCEANNKPIVMDEFVFAYVPGLDHTADIDPNENLPSNDHIVGRFPVTQKGKINQDAVVYSIILGTDVGTWKFNWVGLVNREHNFAGIIQHTREQEKTQNDPLNGQPGDSLVRNLITPYKNAAALTQINVDAEVWQIDFTQRLKAMDERSRQEALCRYEHASFIGDGWKVINHNGALAAMGGRGFVGGLLCIAPQNITIPTPGAGSNVYLTAKFEGQLNGSHQVVTRIVTTTETLDDISIDGDVTTYRQKIAVFNSLSDIDDTRPIEWREKHLDTSTNPHPQYALKTDLDESTGQLQRPATTDRLGLTEIATQQEVDQDLPSDKVVTTRTLGKAALIRSLQNFATNKANEAVATVMGGITKPELDSIRELGLALEQSGDAIRGLFTQIATKLNISTFETFQTAYNQFKAQTLSRLSEIESDLPLKVAVTTFNDYKTWVQQELNKKWVAVSATLSRAGIVQLLDSVTSTSTAHAATPNSVRQANALAQKALDKANSISTAVPDFCMSSSKLLDLGGVSSITESKFKLDVRSYSDPMIASVFTNEGNGVSNFRILEAGRYMITVTGYIQKKQGEQKFGFVRIANVGGPYLEQTKVYVTTTQPNAVSLSWGGQLSANTDLEIQLSLITSTDIPESDMATQLRITVIKLG